MSKYMVPEPPSVREARRTIREWQLRNGHDAYAEPLDGGWRGYQARCWDCDWKGTEFLHNRDEPLGTERARRHKVHAKREAAAHRAATKPEGGSVSETRVDHV